MNRACYAYALRGRGAANKFKEAVHMPEMTITSAQLRGFLAALEAAERSPSTVEGYMRAAREFAAWLGGAELTHRAACEWKLAMSARGCSPSTVNCKIAAVNGLFASMGRDDCKIKPLRRQRQIFRDEGRELTRGEYLRLLNTARRDGKERLALVMETICATGIRVSELRFITRESVRAGVARIALKGKVRTIMIPKRLCEKLLKYAAKQRISRGELFLSRRGTGLSRKQIWADMKALCRRAGVEAGKVFPHNLRHLFARAFYAECRDVVKLADILGHSSLDTTRIYLISTGAEHRALLERMRLIS